MYCVYILKLKDGSYYTGYSNSLKQRISEHKRGIVNTTKNLLPVTLVFYAAFTSKKKALEFEKYIKKGSGFAFRNKRLIS
ncbi:GIY-YIG nuclease family protein [Candidatus Woesebacteria bacterium]|nr:GIY-YIG nuclease family protein [Candidatus Woesebacteria bacterium]